MRNKINFVTGETYSLAEMFSGNRKIIIPDLQRDYCWGDAVHTDERKELVSGFVGNLIEKFEGGHYGGNLNLGLIYGYEAPENHIQLCDGQQRITTLYLLLGMLNRKVGKDNVFRRLLISDYEYLQDDREPYLQYSIRESSLYFISDLVCHFFIVDDNDKYHVKYAESIVNSPWYFNEYNQDPSIQSMIRAISIIERMLDDRDSGWCERFGEFITTKLTFLYFDLDNRENGEETFVVINTTGEPLSATQNMKPLICAEKINQGYDNNGRSVAEDWEEIETWFWKHRCLENGNDTADAGFNEFLRWVTMLKAHTDDDKKALQEILTSGKYTFPRDKISFEDIFSYWKIVVFLFEEWKHKNYLLEEKNSWGSKKTNLLSPDNKGDKNGVKAISQIYSFQLLPLIAYCKQWGIPETADRNLYRLYMFLHNLSRVNNVSRAVNDLVFDALSIANNCKDIVELATNGMNVSTVLLSKEEYLKLCILSDSGLRREEIEEAFWEAQGCEIHASHQIWSGQILPLVLWSTLQDGKFDINAFKRYLNLFDNTFAGECDGNIDVVRRALLTQGLKGYPRIFRGNSVYSFGWDWSEWKTLIDDNIDAFKSFFDDLNGGKTCQQMIDEFPKTQDWAEFVHDERLMGYCDQKKLQWCNNAWFLMKKERMSSPHANIHAYKYFLQRESSDPITSNAWKMDFYPHGLTCVYYNQVHDKEPYISIDIIWNMDGNLDKMEIDLFMKPTGQKKVEEESKERLKNVADVLGYNWERNRYRKFIDICGKGEPESFRLADEETERINGEINL